MRKTSSKIQVGEKHGKLEIVNWYRERNKSGRSKIVVECKCDCGGTHTLQYQTLKYEGGSSCPNCKKSSRFVASNKKKTIQSYYKTLKYHCNRKRMKSKNRDCKISIEEIQQLLKQQNYQCALSGIIISIEDGTASLDRINNDGDYTLDNVQWVHKYINYMKVDIPQDIFIKMCRMVTLHHS